MTADCPSEQLRAAAVAGSVTRAYDNDFRVTSLSVNGGNPIAFSYDQDGLFTQVGDLTLTRNAQNGLVTATALGSVTDTTTYDTFGALATLHRQSGRQCGLFHDLYPGRSRPRREQERNHRRHHPYVCLHLRSGRPSDRSAPGQRSDLELYL